MKLDHQHSSLAVHQKRC